MALKRTRLDDDDDERQRVDARIHNPNYRSRMAMLSDPKKSLAEVGTELDDFILPEED